MQEKRTLYLAGKITGDPYYFTKFYNAQKKLEEGGFIVVNPALLPAEGFTWEAYMRMSGAMLAECAEVCFLPDWKESKGAKYEFGEAMAQNKPFFFFADWEKAQEETNKYEYTTEKTDKIAFQCFVCGKFNVFPATRRQDKRSSIGVAGRSFGAGLQSRALLRLGTGGGNNYRISNQRWHT